MKRDPVIQALKMAVAFRAPPKGCIHHTSTLTAIVNGYKLSQIDKLLPWNYTAKV